MKRYLVTGSSGFIAQHFIKRLELLNSHVIPFTGDITKPADINESFKNIGDIDCVFHFAGISSPRLCENSPELALQVNTEGTRSLAEFTFQKFPSSKFVFMSTSQVYQNSDLPLHEESPLSPLNLYAETKLKAENYLKQIYGDNSKKLIILRLFNHTHKSQSTQFFLPSLYSQILAEIESVKTGNLEIYRDIGALQDLLDALIEITRSDLSGVTYNVCSEVPKKLSELANELAHQLNKKPNFTVESSLVRSEPSKIAGSCQKLRKELNWSPQFATNSQNLIRSFLKEI